LYWVCKEKNKLRGKKWWRERWWKGGNWGSMGPCFPPNQAAEIKAKGKKGWVTAKRMDNDDQRKRWPGNS